MDISAPLDGQRQFFNNDHPGLIMEFMIHYGGQIMHNPKGYHNGVIGCKRFLEPQQVEWCALVDELEDCGYTGDTELYYLTPGMEVPDGLVLMLGPEQVHQLLHDHQGRRQCHLYLHSDATTSSGNYAISGEQDHEHVDLYTIQQFKPFVGDDEASNWINGKKGSDMNFDSENKLKRNRDPWDVYYEHGAPLQPAKQHATGHHNVQDVLAAGKADEDEDDVTGLEPRNIDMVKMIASVSRPRPSRLSRSTMTT